MAGSCFIVGTPIGDEDDFTQRGVRTLQSADMLVAPDEKEAARLLKRFAIAKPLSGIGEELSEELAAEVLERLHRGERVILLNSGIDALGEPIRLLANRIRNAGLEPRIIPGVDLVRMALLMSGFPADRYFVAGSIPMRKEPREEFIRSLSERPETAVVFASAPRLTSTLAGLAMKMPGRRGAVILKPTVPGEIALRGTLGELRERLASKMLSGSATIVLGPQGEEYEEIEPVVEEHSPLLPEDIERAEAEGTEETMAPAAVSPQQDSGPDAGEEEPEAGEEIPSETENARPLAPEQPNAPEETAPTENSPPDSGNETGDADAKD